MTYFADTSDEKGRGITHFSPDSAIVDSNLRPFAFTVKSRGDPTGVTVAAGSRREMESWKAAIRAVIQNIDPKTRRASVFPVGFNPPDDD